MVSEISTNWLKRDLEDSIKKTLDKFFSEDKPESALTDFSKQINSYADNDHLNYYPWSVTWQIGSECNLRCRHCFFCGKEHLFNSQNDLTSAQAIELADLLKDEFSIVSITITGGEPFLREDLFEILKRLKSRNIGIYLHTNGTLVTPQIASKLKEILNPEIDTVQVSLDGASEEIYSRIRGSNIFDKACNGIKNLIEQEIPVAVNCTPTSINLHELPLLYQLCCDLKIKKFSLSRFFTTDKKQEYLIPDTDNLFKSVAEITDMERKNPSTYFRLNLFRFPHLVSNEKVRKFLDNYIDFEAYKDIRDQNMHCNNYKTIYINPDGKIYLCYLAKGNNDENMPVGDFKKESLIDVWNNRYKNIFFQKRNSDKLICKKCKYFCICKGGCPALAFGKYGDFYAPDGECLYGKELMTELKD